MSRIYFHVRNGEDVEVSGQEAHLIHHIVKQIGIGILYNELINGIGDTPLSSWIKIGHMINELQLTTLCGKDLEHAITALTVGLFHQDTSIKYEDTWISPFAWFLTMNSIYGNEVMQLIGQMSGQMEIHAHVKSENFKWFGRLIQQALDLKILRENMNWDKVIGLCDTDEPVIVMSYSVCESFPNQSLSGMSNNDGFYDLPYTKQWDICMKNLDSDVEITPESIGRYYI